MFFFFFFFPSFFLLCFFCHCDGCEPGTWNGVCVQGVSAFGCCVIGCFGSGLTDLVERINSLFVHVVALCCLFFPCGHTNSFETERATLDSSSAQEKGLFVEPLFFCGKCIP